MSRLGQFQSPEWGDSSSRRATAAASSPERVSCAVRGRVQRLRAGGDPVLRVVVTRRPLHRVTIALVVGAVVAAGSFVASGLEWLKVRGALVAAEAEHRALGARHEALRERLAQLDGRSRHGANEDPATDVAAYDKVHDEILEMADVPSAGNIARHPEKF